MKVFRYVGGVFLLIIGIKGLVVGELRVPLNAGLGTTTFEYPEHLYICTFSLIFAFIFFKEELVNLYKILKETLKL